VLVKLAPLAGPFLCLLLRSLSVVNRVPLPTCVCKLWYTRRFLHCGGFMATLLVLDASSVYCSVSLIRDEQTFHLTERQPRRHAQRLLPMVDEILSASAVPRAQLDGIAFGCGPGSFTGIRIAISVAQGIALGLDLPVYGFSGLQIVAQQALGRTRADRVMAVMDAHMGEVFWAEFQRTNGLAVLDGPERVGSPTICNETLASFTGAVAGNGIAVAGVLTESSVSGYADLMVDCEPLSEFAVPVVRRAWEQGKFTGADQCSPVYLRDSVAWKKLDEQPSLLKR
jgi:tRNA threonylcarbamoyladenosine biosynthesis protein TsaB